MSSFFNALFASVLTLFAGEPPRATTYGGHFAGGVAPIVVNQNLARKNRQLNFEAYAVLYSGISRTPVWSAEHLSAKRITAARELQRKNTFHAEQRLPVDERAELEDYVRSGFDRGHMSPSGDMPSASAQYDSFSLANIIPQHPKNNQILWQGIEDVTRNTVMREGDLYVVTGPLFEGEALQRLNGRVLVPTAVFKAIYSPGRNSAGAYVARNAPGMSYQTLSIAELEVRSGINIFPSLTQGVKSVKMSLPVPTPYNGRGREKPTETEFLPD